MAIVRDLMVLILFSILNEPFDSFIMKNSLKRVIC